MIIAQVKVRNGCKTARIPANAREFDGVEWVIVKKFTLTTRPEVLPNHPAVEAAKARLPEDTEVQNTA